MTRRILALALTAALAGCNGDEDGPKGLLAGFAPAEDGVLVVPATDCTATFGYTVTALLVGFTTFTNLCGFVQATDLCGDVASSTAVTVSVLRARNALPAPASIGPGTYAVTGTATVELGGSLVAAFADITQTGPSPSCTEPSYPALKGGTLVLTTVDESHVVGTVDVTFDDGSHFQTAFDAPICSHPVDVCDLLADSPSCTAPVCCPTSTTCPT